MSNTDNRVGSAPKKICQNPLQYSSVGIQWDIGMRFWSQWRSHISRIWDLTPSSRMTTLTPTEAGSSQSTSRIWEWRGWNGLPWVQTSTQLNTYGISLGVLYVSEWPTQPCWLTCDKSWLRNGMPSHSSVWPGWWPAWGGGAKLLWLRMDLPHATEVPDRGKLIKCKNGQYVLFFPYYWGRVQSSNPPSNSKRGWIPTEEYCRGFWHTFWGRYRHD